MEAGFVHVVQVGQYFMTKDTHDFRQFRSVTCREYTLPRDDKSSQSRGYIQGKTRIGPVLEVTTSYQYGKHGIKIRILSVGQDNSQSWIRMSYGTIKYVVDSNYNNTEVPADPHKEQASQPSVKVIAVRSKAKAKPQKRETADGLILSHQNPLSLCVRSLEESDLSSSTQSKSTAGRRWSNSILENQVSSSKSILTNSLLVR